MALFMFDTEINLGTVATGNIKPTPTLGPKTFCYFTAGASTTLIGLAQAGGNIDGYVIALFNLGASTALVASESGSEGVPADRFRLPAGGSLSLFQYRCAMFRYSLAQLRWFQIGNS